MYHFNDFLPLDVGFPCIVFQKEVCMCVYDSGWKECTYFVFVCNKVAYRQSDFFSSLRCVKIVNSQWLVSTACVFSAYVDTELKGVTRELVLLRYWHDTYVAIIVFVVYMYLTVILLLSELEVGFEFVLFKDTWSQ